MESQPQNPEFRNNPENFHSWVQHSAILHTTTQAKMTELWIQHSAFLHTETQSTMIELWIQHSALLHTETQAKMI